MLLLLFLSPLLSASLDSHYSCFFIFFIFFIFFYNQIHPSPVKLPPLSAGGNHGGSLLRNVVLLSCNEKVQDETFVTSDLYIDSATLTATKKKKKNHVCILLNCYYNFVVQKDNCCLDYSRRRHIFEIMIHCVAESAGR